MKKLVLCGAAAAAMAAAQRPPPPERASHTPRPCSVRRGKQAAAPPGL